MVDESVGLLTGNRQDWFWMLVSYMKMKTWAAWLAYYPDTPYESFELLWPTLFDQMLAEATRSAIEKLGKQNLINPN